MTKILDVGYWVSALYKYQSILYWVGYSIYFRSITFFTAANPGMYLGGMLDDSKSDLYQMVDPKYLPKTIVVRGNKTITAEALARQGLQFPLILKPDIGYKGFMVKKVDSIEELKHYLPQENRRSMLVQEFLDNTREFSIMCYYDPAAKTYRISSFVEKHLPKIVGDGVNTIKTLIEALDNPFLDMQWLRTKWKTRQDDILPIGETLTIDIAANYSRGAKFENLAPHIDVALTKSMNNFFSNLSGIKFGRLDLKACDIKSIKKGDFKLLEFNGAKSEPIHIYDPQVSWTQRVKDIHAHWQYLKKIVQMNQSTTQKVSNVEGLQAYWKLKKLIQS